VQLTGAGGTWGCPVIEVDQHAAAEVRLRRHRVDYEQASLR